MIFTCYEQISEINLTWAKTIDHVALLSVRTHKSLNFKQHIDNLVRKAQNKLRAQRHTRKFLTVEKI